MGIRLLNGSERQRAWWNEAVAAFRYPVSEIADIEVAWVTEPRCPGHSEFACCTGMSDGSYRIEIRSNLDQPGREPTGLWTGKEFYLETCVHELAHVIAGVTIVNAGRVAQVSAMFDHISGVGASPEEPVSNAELESRWTAGLWEEHVEEAVAETIKDLWLPLPSRRYLNRTQWRLRRSEFADFLAVVGAAWGAGEFIEFEGDVYERVRVSSTWWDGTAKGQPAPQSLPPRPWVHQFTGPVDRQPSLDGSRFYAYGAVNFDVFWPQAALARPLYLIAGDLRAWPKSNHSLEDPRGPFADTHLADVEWSAARAPWTHPRLYPNVAGSLALPRFPVGSSWPINDATGRYAVIPVEFSDRPEVILVSAARRATAFAPRTISAATGPQFEYGAGYGRHQLNVRGHESDVERIKQVEWGVYFPRGAKIPTPPWPYVPETLFAGAAPPDTIRRGRP